MIGGLLSDYTIRSVLLGSALLGIVAGTLGSFAVLRQRSLLGDTMSHAALPGIALAFLLTGSKSPLILLGGAALTGWLGTLVILLITGKTTIREDGAQGIVLSVFFGVGLMLLSKIQRMPHAAKAGLDKFLFGQAATLMTEDILVMTLVGSVAFLIMLIFWKEFKLLSFDGEYLSALGFPARRLEYLLTFLIVAAVVIGLQTVGVVLMSAMVVAPAASARQWTNRLEGMVALSGFFGALAGVTGALISSLVPRLPTGPAIVIILGIISAISLTAAPGRGLISQLRLRARNKQTYGAERIFRDLWAFASSHEDYGHPHSLETLRVLSPERPRSVDGALESLRRRGLVRRDEKGRYAVTPAGREYAQTQEGGA